MAAFQYEGNTYFYSGGKWLDSQSKILDESLSRELTEFFSRNKEKTNVVSKSVDIKKDVATPHRASARIKDQKKQHRIARERIYSKVQLSDDQKKAIAILESGKNVFLSGEAGTGKSFVLNEFIRRNRDKNIIVCAPTGIAAINVGGSTLHRTFKVPIGPSRSGDYNSKPDNAIIKADVIVIDEISMCRFDIFEYVIKTIRHAEMIRQNNENADAMSNSRIPKIYDSKQIIVVGDFYQLAPVISNKDKDILLSYWNEDAIESGFAFETSIWKECDFKNIVLKEVIRQQGSIEFITNLNKVRVGNGEGIEWFNSHSSNIPINKGIYLCGTNDVADSINSREASKINSKSRIYSSQTKGQVLTTDKVTADTLELKVGLQVMTLINDMEEGYQNGSIGVITSLMEDYVIVKLNSGKIVNVRPYDWEILGYEVQKDKIEKVVLGNFKQLPIKIAYAITIHKSQGQTYEAANIYPDCFACGQLYVALSRVTKIEGLYLAHKILGSSLKTSSAVGRFYDNLIEENMSDYVYEEKNIEEVLVQPKVENVYESAGMQEKKVHSTSSKNSTAIYDKVMSMSEDELKNSCHMYQTIRNKPSAYSAWTDEEEKQLIEEMRCGYSISRMANIHCRTNGAIRSRIKKIKERQL